MSKKPKASPVSNGRLPKEQQDKYKILFENMAQGVFYQRADGVLVDVNRAALEMFGLTREEFIGRTSQDPKWDVLDEQGRSLKPSEHPSMKALRTGKIQREQVCKVLNPRKKDYVWIQINAIPQFRPNKKKPYQVFVTLQDISETRRAEEKHNKAEEELQESENRYRTLFEEALDASFVADVETGIITDCNDAALRLLGKKRSEIIGSHQKTLHPPEAGDGQFSSTFRKHRDQLQVETIETRVVTKSGEIKDVEIRASVFKLGGKKLVQANFHDITERKQMEDALKESEEKYRFLFDAVPLSMGISTLGGRPLAANRSLVELAGYANEELFVLINDIKEMYVDPGRRKQLVNILRKDGKVRDFEAALKRKDGTVFYALLNVDSINLGGEQVFLTTLRDITERKKANEQILALSKFPAENPNLVLRIARDGEILYSNKAGLELLAHWDVKIGEKAPARWRRLIKEALKSAKPGLQEEEEEVKNRIFSVVIAPVAEAGYVNLYGRDITEHKQAEEALRVNEERYRSLFDNMLDGLAYCRMEYNAGRPADFVYVAVNKAYKLLTGLKEVVGKRFSQVISGAQGPDKELLEICGRVVRTGIPEQFERYVHSLGMWFWTSVFRQPGTKEYFFVVFDDITEHKQAEAALQKEKDFSENIIKTTQAIVLVLDKQGRIVTINPFMEKISGYSLEEVKGKDWFETFLPKENRAKIREIFLRAIGDIQTKGNVNAIIAKDGHELWIEWYDKTIKGADGSIEGLITIGVDITERRLADDKLRMMQFAVDNYVDTVFWVAPDARLVYVNQAGCMRLGYSFEELTQMKIHDLDPDYPVEKWPQHWQQFREKGTLQFETTHRTKSGVRIPVEVLASHLVFGDREFVISIVHDITERKSVETKIADSLKEKEILLREINHRVKNNLQIINSLYNLQAEKIKDEKTKNILKESQARVKSISLVHEKLYQSRDLSKIDMDEYVKSLVKGIKHLFAIDPERLSIDINVEKDIDIGIDLIVNCGLIINELVTNAFKYAFPDGRSGVISIGFHKIAEGEYRLIVSDNGVGMPEGFDIAAADTLGLELVRLLANQMGSLEFDVKNGITVKVAIKNEG